MGLLLVVGFLEYRDSSFKTEEDVMRVLSLPVLALVPVMGPTRGLASTSARNGGRLWGSRPYSWWSRVRPLWLSGTSSHRGRASTMYQAFYGLRELPFELTPNPSICS